MLASNCRFRVDVFFFFFLDWKKRTLLLGLVYGFSILGVINRIIEKINHWSRRRIQHKAVGYTEYFVRNFTWNATTVVTWSSYTRINGVFSARFTSKEQTCRDSKYRIFSHKRIGIIHYPLAKEGMLINQALHSGLDSKVDWHFSWEEKLGEIPIKISCKGESTASIDSLASVPIWFDMRHE